MAAVIIGMVGVAIKAEDVGNIVAVRDDISLWKAFESVLLIVLAYGKRNIASGLHRHLLTVLPAGHVAFFGFATELREVRDFPKSLALMQISATCFYVLVSIFFCYFAGNMVTSPALGSAPKTLCKVAFGVACPTIVIAGVVNGSVACKFVWVTFWQTRKRPDVVRRRGGIGRWSWIFVVASMWILSWIIAEVIPDFNTLLSLIVSLF